MAISLIDKVKTLFQLITEPTVLRLLLSLRNTGYLVDIGWFKAFKTQSAIDQNNDPLPWVTYSFIDFISPRLNKTMKIFEYGSGFSTLFYSKRTQSVAAVEHNKVWYQKMLKHNLSNVQIIFFAEDENGYYCASIEQIKKEYDLIIIDAIDRVNCVKKSLHSLAEGGVLILDDSEREEYAEVFSFMASNDFKHIEFWGISPGCFIRKATTVFYRTNNCLNI